MEIGSTLRALGATEWVRPHNSDRISRLIAVGICAVGVACAGHLNPVVTPSLTVQDNSTEYAQIDGRDTVGFELVTRCRGRIIADSEARDKQAYVHYEAELGDDGIPTLLSFHIWNKGAPASGPPTQVGRHFVIGDTAVTEVRQGDLRQTQKSAVAPGTFPILTGAVGLELQLMRVLRKSGNGASVPVLFIATGGASVRAVLTHMRGDTMVVQLGQDEIRSEWDQNEFRRSDVSGSSFSIVATGRKPENIATARCNVPRMTPPTPIQRVSSLVP
jgi:hypothetical protein